MTAEGIRRDNQNASTKSTKTKRQDRLIIVAVDLTDIILGVVGGVWEGVLGRLDYISAATEFTLLFLFVFLVLPALEPPCCLFFGRGHLEFHRLSHRRDAYKTGDILDDC